MPNYRLLGFNQQLDYLSEPILFVKKVSTFVNSTFLVGICEILLLERFAFLDDDLLDRLRVFREHTRVHVARLNSLR